MTDPVQGYGNALAAYDAWQVEPGTGLLYQYKAHPTITSLSMHAVGLGGASSLIIAGSGFSWTPSENVVMLAGAPCLVTTSSLTSLTCSPSSVASPTDPAPASGVPLGRGLVHTVYWSPTRSGWWWWSFVNSPAAPLPAGSVSSVNTDAVKSWSVNGGEYFVEELQV